MRPRVTAEVQTPDWPSQVKVGSGAIWTVAGQVARVDTMTNEVEVLPHGANDVAVGAGSVWVARYLGDRGEGIVRMHPDTGVDQATIPIPGEVVSPLVADDTAVWAGVLAKGQASIVRIDPRKEEVTAVIPLRGSGLPPPDAIHSVADIAVDEGAVWVLTPEWSGDEISGAFVVKIDAASDRIVGMRRIGYSLWLEVGGGAVWAESGLRGGVRIDPETLVDEPFDMRGGFAPFGVGEGGVWFITDEPGGGTVAVSRLDPATMQVDLSVSLRTTPTWSAGLDTMTHTIWVGTEESSLIRIDLR